MLKLTGRLEASDCLTRSNVQKSAWVAAVGRVDAERKDNVRTVLKMALPAFKKAAHAVPPLRK